MGEVSIKDMSLQALLDDYAWPAKYTRSAIAKEIGRRIDAAQAAELEVERLKRDVERHLTIASNEATARIAAEQLLRRIIKSTPHSMCADAAAWAEAEALLARLPEGGVMKVRHRQLCDHVLSVKVNSHSNGEMRVIPEWRDKPTEDDKRDGIDIKYGFMDRMAVAAWMEDILNRALKEGRRSFPKEKGDG